MKKSSASSRQGKRRPKNVESITAELAAELGALVAQPDAEIDTSDIPEKLDWSNADVGRFYRPVKKLVSMRVDADVLDWFQTKGDGYTALMNQSLRSYVTAQEALAAKKQVKGRR